MITTSPEHQKVFALIIIGPTASGKTGFSEEIARHIPAEIINADVGQFYEPLTIGTAKPDWKNSPIPSHLFDVLSSPEDLSVFRYRQLVGQNVQEIQSRGKLPIIVGGSLFYVKSLFFPPHELKTTATPVQPLATEGMTSQQLWDLLQEIDPERAAQLHPHDEYRLQRALAIWQKTGEKPSTYAPEYQPPFNSLMVFLSPPREKLRVVIQQRTEQMIDQGWIEEAKKLINTPWEEFLTVKGLIGYPEIFAWIRNGEREEEKLALIERIKLDTVQYAKRQVTFAKGFFKLFAQHETQSSLKCTIKIIENNTQENIQEIIRLCLSLQHK